MTPLPAPLGGGDLVAWRLDETRHAETWDSGEGSYRSGGRWNGKGVRAVYCAIDPATAIVEVAAHKGFKALDTVRHTLTAVTISEPESVHVVHPEDVPNPSWLSPGIPGAGQQEFGYGLLERHKFVVIPSAVSSHSWNPVFVTTTAAGAYGLRGQEAFTLDTRLHPSAET